jgi:hypothetical protein
MAARRPHALAALAALARALVGRRRHLRPPHTHTHTPRRTTRILSSKTLFLATTSPPRAKNIERSKLKKLMAVVEASPFHELWVFVTGMHMLKLYGSTYVEVVKDGYQHIYTYVNQHLREPMESIFGNTISGLSRWVRPPAPPPARASRRRRPNGRSFSAAE